MTMTNNECLEDVCKKIANFKNTTQKTSYKRSLSKYYDSDLSAILVDFPLIALHDELIKQGFLIKYNSLAQIIATLKKQKNKTPEIKKDNPTRENSHNQQQTSNEIPNEPQNFARDKIGKGERKLTISEAAAQELESLNLVSEKNQLLANKLQKTK